MIESYSATEFVDDVCSSNWLGPEARRDPKGISINGLNKFGLVRSLSVQTFFEEDYLAAGLTLCLHQTPDIGEVTVVLTGFTGKESFYDSYAYNETTKKDVDLEMATAIGNSNSREGMLKKFMQTKHHTRIRFLSKLVFLTESERHRLAGNRPHPASYIDSEVCPFYVRADQRPGISWPPGSAERSRWSYHLNLHK